MFEKGNYVKCPECGGEARVVWISKTGKTAAIKCTKYHSQISPPPTKFAPRPQAKTKKGMVFIVNIT